MRIDVTVETEISRSVRAQQLEAMFDVPAAEKCRLEWRGELPIEEKDWNVGLIVGPSGAGKSSIARQLFAETYHPELEWNGKSVIDDFSKSLTMEQIAAGCQ